jgi:sugar/nucleoside kinase (ribokinase family)
MLICTLGDLLLDVVVRPGDEASAAGYERTATTAVGAGGQAANVAAWAAALGASARFVGKRGADAAGELVTRELEDRGVDVVGPVAHGRNGVVVSLVGSDGARTMISDRGVAPTLAAEELDLTWFTGCAALHVSGYSVYREPIAAAATAAIEAARAEGARISIDLSSAAAIVAFGADRLRSRLEELQLDLVFANEEELSALGGPAPAPVVVAKRGADGFVVGSAGGEQPFAAAPVDVVDTTGAGDALAAGFLVGGPELARTAAADCIARLGSMPERSC